MFGNSNTSTSCDRGTNSSWHPHIWSHGSYDPVMAGSIDGTDREPHDRAIIRALSSFYHPICSSILHSNPKATLFIGRLPPIITQQSLEDALLTLLSSSRDCRGDSTRSDSRRSSRSRTIKHRSRSPFSSTSPEQSPRLSGHSKWPRVRIVRNLVTGYPCGYAFAEFYSPDDAERVLRNWVYRSRRQWDDQRNAKSEGLDVPNGEKIILEPAFAETLTGWRPRRLGGGLGGRKEAGQLRFGGIARPFRRPFIVKHD